MKIIRCRCTLESISLEVQPTGFLSRGMTITISCTVRYGAPASPRKLSQQQEPKITLSLDNKQPFTGKTKLDENTVGNKMFRKTMVSQRTEPSCLLL